jgi:hypothetical protein
VFITDDDPDIENVPFMNTLPFIFNVDPSNVKLDSATAEFVVPSEVSILLLPKLEIVLKPVPELPLEPDDPDVPDEPDVADVPDEPEDPDVPDEPDVADVPELPEVPLDPDKPCLVYPVDIWSIISFCV